jgi:hypothetical protein
VIRMFPSIIYYKAHAVQTKNLLATDYLLLNSGALIVTHLVTLPKM